MPGRLTWAVAALAVALTTATGAHAQTRRLFGEDTELAFTLNAPFNRLIRGAESSTDPYPATIAVGSESWPLQIAPRGFTRRTGDLCTFPPLRLDFDKPAMAGTFFDGQNKLKLVTQCRPQANYEQLLVREYTVYRLYNAVTPLSFRVRPASVTYRDNEGRRDDATRFAFLIESAGDVGRRNGVKEIEVDARALASTQIDAAGMARFALFQFVIGNLDWEYFRGPAGDTCCHNGKLFGPEGATTDLAPVPYDFDFSGLVDAPYAAPPEGLRVSGPFDRFYRGHCRANDFVPAAAAHLLSKRGAFAAIIAGETRLTDQSKRVMQRFLDASFEILADPARLQREIARCR
jgi:hypothetical protein